MSGYLDDYGTAEAKREKIIKGLLLAVVVLAVIGGVLYFLFRDVKEKERIDQFIQLLEQKDYRGAYALWGCTEQQPCPDYPFDKFMEDWGPKSDHPDIARAELGKTNSCKEGVIQTLSFGQDDDVWLYVDRQNLAIAYAPWPTCHPLYVPPK